MYWEVQRKFNLVQVGIKHTYSQLDRCIQGGPVKIQTPTQWNLIGHSMTALPPMLSSSSILLPTVSLRFHSSKEKSSVQLKM
jgi:hypothetical protein